MRIAIVSLFLLMLTLSLPQRARGETPAEELCDLYSAGAPEAKANAIVSFVRETGATIATVQQPDTPCVASNLDKLELDRAAYCSARASAGHDLQLRELRSLESELSLLMLTCSEERNRRLQEVLESAHPGSCAELIASFNAALDLLESYEPQTEISVSCRKRAASRIGPRVTELCDSGTITLAAAVVELSERAAHACEPGE